MNRKSFLKLMAMLGASSVPTRTAYARNSTNDSNLIPFTEDIAQNITKNFISENFSVSAGVQSITPIIDFLGNPYGYYASIHLHNRPYGYAVLNPNAPGVIEEFCFEECSGGPNDLSLKPQSRTTEKNCLVRQGPCVYMQSLESASPHAVARSNDPTTWENLMIKESEINDEYYDGPYTLSDVEEISRFSYISNYLTKSQLRKYACVVNALCSIATNIPTCQGSFLLTMASLASHFDEIWNKTETTVDHTKDGITYGSTPYAKAGPGFVSYASNHGVTLKSTYLNSKPPIQRYKTHVHANKFSLILAGINTIENGEIKRSGHGMAVRGTAVLKRGSLSLPCLHVFDGWLNCVYLNYASSAYTDIQGTFFD